MGGTQLSRSEELGQVKEVQLDQGTIRYRERGAGQPIVFVHGVLLNGDVWRKVVPHLAPDFRCVTPDWPLGSHEVALNADADLSPPGLARLIADFLTALNLEDVTLVGNNTGGAFCQLVISEHPERVARLVLTNCDAFDNFPPAMARPLFWAGSVFPFAFLMAQSLRLGIVRRMFFRFAAKRPIEREILDSYCRPAASNGAVRRDGRKFLRGISPKYTLAAASRFREFRRPVLLAWAPEDRLFFSWKWAEKLRDAFPDARLERVDDSYFLVPEDQPQRLAELIAVFMREPAGAST